jgi:hypothetical protein
MSIWTPSRVPKIRDRLLRELVDPESLTFAQMLEDDTESLIRILDAADLYWVTPEMARVARSSMRTLPGVRFIEEDRPSKSGLVIYGNGLGKFVDDESGHSIPFDAIVWGPHPDGIYLCLFGRKDRSEFAQCDGPPLLPICSTTYPVRNKLGTLSSEGFLGISIAGTILYATWLLMQQPKLVETTPAEVERKIRRGYARVGRAQPKVTLVTLRREYRQQPASDADSKSGRHYSHRWIVRGHWRQQPYGPGREQHRPTWIPAHVKGPEGADLLTTAKVNVWRR